ncbi:ankyrin repeat domain-containing protein [Dactylosporangium sp. CS-047395]|uniref:ankyrin repeat domain-containing protein n=1 Tax=Dactylosporangium sp. CS-047395 TaxID=3239936 RepID=UPI003D8A93AE
MPTRGMPERPNLERFRRLARTLQRSVRAGETGAVQRITALHPSPVPPLPTFPLSAALLVVAREYGFASWPRLTRYIRTVAEHGWNTRLGSVAAADPADEFCRLACLTYSGEDGPDRWTRARDLLTRHPDLTSGHIWAAAAAARPDDVRRLLADRPDLASTPGGPLRWRPLFCLVYSRFDPGVPQADVLAAARALLDAGADPNDGYLFDGLPSPFTLLTGVFGSGEQGRHRQPTQPHWRALGRLLLDAGADPNDAQTLYNRMFEPDDSHLELLFEYGLGTGDGGPWKARIDTLQTPAQMLRIQLRWAVEHGQAARVRLLSAHGVDVAAPFTDDGPPWAPGDGRTPLELAELYGSSEIASFLVAQGVPRPAADPAHELIAAVFRADRSTVERLTAAHPGAATEAKRRRPGLMVWAAGRPSADAGGDDAAASAAAAVAPTAVVALLAELGFDVNAYGRGDAPADGAWETALHHAAANGDVALARLLLDLGADPALHDRRFDGTPLDWARHFQQEATIALLTASAPGG